MVDKKEEYKAPGGTKPWKGKCIEFQPVVRPALARIESLEDLGNTLPMLCQDLMSVFGTQNLEATYQRALAIDLVSLGVAVHQEESIALVYKGREVGSRRIDIICSMSNGDVAILELKAVREGGLSELHTEQLQYYMEHCEIETGFLINFPHEPGWHQGGGSNFVAVNVLPTGPSRNEGIPVPSSPSHPKSHSKDQRTAVEIVKVTKLDIVDQETTTANVTAAPAPARATLDSTGLFQAFASIEISDSGNSLHSPTAAPPKRAVGQTAANRDCKVCLKTASGYCRTHLSQNKEKSWDTA